MLNLEIKQQEHNYIKHIAGLESLMIDTNLMVQNYRFAQSANQAGLLSDVALKTLVASTNKVIAKISPDELIRDGLESDVVAGLESIGDTIKAAVAKVLAVIGKILNNLEFFFKNAWTSLITRTKDMKKEIESLIDEVSKKEDNISVDYSKVEKTIVKYFSLIEMIDQTKPSSLVATSGGISKVMAGFEHAIDIFTDSKIPLAKVDGDELEIFMPKIHAAEQRIIDKELDPRNFKIDLSHLFGGKSLKDIIKEGGTARLLDFNPGTDTSKGKSSNICKLAVFNKNGRNASFDVEWTSNTAFYSAKDLAGTQLSVSKKDVLSFLNIIKDGITNFEKLKTENPVRLRTLKQSSDKVIANLRKEWSEKSESEKGVSDGSFTIILKDVGSIWRILPDISNSNIKSGFRILNDALTFSKQVVKAEGKRTGKEEVVDTEIVD